jgi:hypothetical protein
MEPSGLDAASTSPVLVREKLAQRKMQHARRYYFVSIFASVRVGTTSVTISKVPKVR